MAAKVEWRGRWQRWVRAQRPDAPTLVALAPEDVAEEGPALPGLEEALLVVLVPPLPPKRRRRRSHGASDFTEAKAIEAIVGGRKRELTDLRDLAERTVARAAAEAAALELPELLFPDAETVALLSGFFVTPDGSARACGAEGIAKDTLFVAARRQTQRNVTIFHEHCHAILRADGKPYTHGDVWILTILLAVPSACLKHADIARHVPKWVIQARRRIAREITQGM